MRYLAPLLATVGLIALAMIFLAMDAMSVRWSITTAIRRRLMVRDIDIRAGWAVSRLALIVDSAAYDMLSNRSQVEIMSSLLQEMERAVATAIGPMYQYRCQWSIDNRSSQQELSYGIVLELTITVPDEGIEARITRTYHLLVPLGHYPGEMPLEVISDGVLG